MATRTAKDTREAILDACDRIMSRFGFRKMTMADLAREAGVSKRTIYLHFQCKEDVGLSSIGRVVEKVFREMRSIGDSPGIPEEKLRAMLRTRVMSRVFAVRDYHESLDELFEVVRPAYMARRNESFERETALIAGVLSLGGIDEPTESAQTLLLATNAFLPYSLSVRELGQPEEIERRLLGMIDLLVRGLRLERK